MTPLQTNWLCGLRQRCATRPTAVLTQRIYWSMVMYLSMHDSAWLCPAMHHSLLVPLFRTHLCLPAHISKQERAQWHKLAERHGLLSHSQVDAGMSCNNRRHVSLEAIQHVCAHLHLVPLNQQRCCTLHCTNLSLQQSWISSHAPCPVQVSSQYLWCTSETCCLAQLGSCF